MTHEPGPAMPPLRSADRQVAADRARSTEPEVAGSIIPIPDPRAGNGSPGNGSAKPPADPPSGSAVSHEDFLAMLAHELRNPLAPIANAVAVLHGATANEPLLQWVHDVIRRQVTTLTHLVDDMLDAARITAGKVTLDTQPVPMRAVLDRAAVSARSLIDQRHQQLTVALPQEPLFVNGDMARLGQIFGNLLQNAAKYTQDGGAIGLTATVENHSVVVRVSDSGIGITAEALPRIFELFQQGHGPLSGNPGGLGIGLTVVRSLVSLHGGTVEAQSAGPDQGSEFTVTLPLTAPPASAPGVPLPPPAAHQAGARRRIVLIDDNADSNAALGMLLRQVGHDVVAALNGLDGLELVREKQPDIVLCDIGLAGMDGYAVVKRLHEMDLAVHPVMIAITGYGRPEDRARALDAGFEFHLVKPVDPGELLRLIGSVQRPSTT